MKKKVMYLVLNFMIAQVVLYSCCKDEQYVSLTNFWLYPVDTTFDESPTSVLPENFRLELSPVFTRVSQSLSKSLIPNAAYAITCDPRNIVREPVTEVTVTSNVDIQGVAAGASLNNLLRYQNYFEDEATYEFSSLISDLNDSYSNDVLLHFINPITDVDSATFSIKIVLENDFEITQTTETITFE